MQKILSMAMVTGVLLATHMPCGATPTLTAIYNFPYNTGAFPEAGLVLNNGQLVGTTFGGGTSGWGTVFSLSPSGSTWTFHELYSFTGGADGANPRSNVIFSSRGVIFGTTEQGGAHGYGTVYTLTPTGGGKWTEAVIYSFTGQSGDGANPEAGLVFSPRSVLYGTTAGGGSAGYGTVFSLTPATGGTWTEQVIYSFKGAPAGCGMNGNAACEGASPLGSLLLNSNGKIFGTTYGGTAISGGAEWGTVFQLTPLGGGNWTEQVLYSFLGAPSGVDGGTTCGTNGAPACDGGAPVGNVVLNQSTGAIYGTTTLGGNPAGCPLGGYLQGCGAVFQLLPPVPPSTTWTESLLYAFGGAPQDGSLPSYNIVYPTSGGPIYGTTYTGGSSSEMCFPTSYKGCGTAYVLRPPTPPATTWTKSTMATFNGATGAGPNGVILSSAGGVLYGTAYEGGVAGGYGTVFQITF